MTDERYRIPQDEVYFQAVGLAAVAFARLEWDAVWCCERLKPGYITTVESGKKTAGVIAEDLKKLFSRISNSNLRAKLTPMAVEFKENEFSDRCARADFSLNTLLYDELRPA